jgi:damage-control phosphatase, subfamily I
MQTVHDCLPCFVNLALGSLKNCGASDGQVTDAMRKVFRELAEIDYRSTPPVTARMICRIVSEVLGVEDLYANQKRHFNGFAETLLPVMQKKIVAEQDIFAVKVKLSIAANIIDFGKNTNLSEDEVLENFERAMHASVSFDAVTKLKNALRDAETVLFLCDNAGEIVFDRFLIEELPCEKLTCVVRGMPVLNDATLEDAEAIGLTAMVKVIANGSDAPGTLLDECSSEFMDHFTAADVVIAKGQGNFETLSGITGKRIFYLLQVKCPLVARDIGLPVGSLAIVDSAEGRQEKMVA